MATVFRFGSATNKRPLKAFAMLDAIGETEARAVFYRDLQYKAQSGSPKAIAALKKIKP